MADHMQCRTMKVVVGWGRLAEQKSSVGRTRMFDRVRYGRMAEQSSVGRRTLTL